MWYYCTCVFKGLDPGGAYFQCMPANQTLDPSDATFVDIVHTNQGEFGYNGRIGHVDFYINGGGPKQPGCEQVKRDNCKLFLTFSA